MLADGSEESKLGSQTHLGGELGSTIQYCMTPIRELNFSEPQFFLDPNRSDNKGLFENNSKHQYILDGKCLKRFDFP